MLMHMEASEPKRVNPVLNIIVVNSLRIGGHRLSITFFLIILIPRHTNLGSLYAIIGICHSTIIDEEKDRETDYQTLII